MIRMATCKEFADDTKSVAKTNNLFMALESKATPSALLLGLLLTPWFPDAAKKHKEEATRELYEMISSYVDVRRNADVPNSDAIDVLIADGSDNSTVVGVRVYITLHFFWQAWRLIVRLLVHYRCNIRWCQEYGHDLCVSSPFFLCISYPDLLPIFFTQRRLLDASPSRHQRHVESQSHNRDTTPPQYLYPHPRSFLGADPPTPLHNPHHCMGRRDARHRSHHA